MRMKGKWKLLAMLLVLMLMLTGCTSTSPNSSTAESLPTATAEDASPEITPETVPTSASGTVAESALGSAPDVSEKRPMRAVTTTITLADGNITIKGPGARAQGSTLIITADGVYELSGTLTSGQVIVEAPDAAKVELVLSGVDITASENAAIYCKNADELIITLTEGMHNKGVNRDSFFLSVKFGVLPSPEGGIYIDVNGDAVVVPKGFCCIRNEMSRPSISAWS